MSDVAGPVQAVLRRKQVPEPLSVQQLPGAIGIRCPEGIPGDGIALPPGEIVIGTIHNTAHLASIVDTELAVMFDYFAHIVRNPTGICLKVIEENPGVTVQNSGMSVQPVERVDRQLIGIGDCFSFRTGQQTDLLIVFVIGIDLAAGVLPDRIPLPVKKSEVGKADPAAVGEIEDRGWYRACPSRRSCGEPESAPRSASGSIRCPGELPPAG